MCLLQCQKVVERSVSQSYQHLQNVLQSEISISVSKEAHGLSRYVDTVLIACYTDCLGNSSLANEITTVKWNRTKQGICKHIIICSVVFGISNVFQ